MSNGTPNFIYFNKIYHHFFNTLEKFNIIMLKIFEKKFKLYLSYCIIFKNLFLIFLHNISKIKK